MQYPHCNLAEDPGGIEYADRHMGRDREEGLFKLLEPLSITVSDRQSRTASSFLSKPTGQPTPCAAPLSPSCSWREVDPIRVEEETSSFAICRLKSILVVGDSHNLLTRYFIHTVLYRLNYFILTNVFNP